MSKTVLMAFAKGLESSEGVDFKRYIGLGVCNVIAINPTKEELETLYKTTLDKDPEYTSKDDNGIPQVRLDFIVKTIPEKNDGIEFTSKVTFFLRNSPRFNKDSTKIQVINKYGETTWIPVDMAKKGEIPANMSWYLGPYRPAFSGEEDLNSFLKVYLNIPTRSWKDPNSGEVHNIEDPTTAEAQLENIKDYFSGNVKELRDVISLQKENKIKIPFGIKTTEDNKEYQTAFTKMFLRSGSKNSSRLDAAIKDAQDNGAYTNCIFSTQSLKEYVVNPTEFKNSGEPQNSSSTDWFNDGKSK